MTRNYMNILNWKQEAIIHLTNKENEKMSNSKTNQESANL